MEERLDGTLRITHQGEAPASHPIAEHPVRPAQPLMVSRQAPIY